MRYGAFNGLTTSGVEQTFTVQDRVIDPQRQHCAINTEMDELELRIDNAWTRDKSEVTKTCKSAMQFWSRFYGEVRESGKKAKRIDAGVKRKAPQASCKRSAIKVS